jgi:hypothetical protein
MPPLSLRRPLASLRLLFAHKGWLIGFLAGIGGWVLYVAALALAPLSLVQATSAGGLGSWICSSRGRRAGVWRPGSGEEWRGRCSGWHCSRPRLPGSAAHGGSPRSKPSERGLRFPSRPRGSPPGPSVASWPAGQGSGSRPGRAARRATSRPRRRCTVAPRSSSSRCFSPVTAWGSLRSSSGSSAGGRSPRPAWPPCSRMRSRSWPNDALRGRPRLAPSAPLGRLRLHRPRRDASREAVDERARPLPVRCPPGRGKYDLTD